MHSFAVVVNQDQHSSRDSSVRAYGSVWVLSFCCWKSLCLCFGVCYGSYPFSALVSVTDQPPSPLLLIIIIIMAMTVIAPDDYASHTYYICSLCLLFSWHHSNLNSFVHIDCAYGTSTCRPGVSSHSYCCFKSDADHDSVVIVKIPKPWFPSLAEVEHEGGHQRLAIPCSESWRLRPFNARLRCPILSSLRVFEVAQALGLSVHGLGSRVSGFRFQICRAR